MIIMIVGLGIFASILGKVADIVATGSRSARQEQEVRKKLTGAPPLPLQCYSPF